MQYALPVVAYTWLACVVEAGLAAGDGSEYLDAGLTAAYLATHGLERLIASMTFVACGSWSMISRLFLNQGVAVELA